MTKEYCAYFYDELFEPHYDLPEKVDAEHAGKILEEYAKIYDPNDDNSEWFAKIKRVCPLAGFAADTKEYKAAPDKFNGSPADASTVIRMAITGRKNTPNLCEIMACIGRKRCAERINNMIEFLKRGK